MAEHRLIADPEIHEPKGVAGAAADRVYKSSGAGTGAWSQVDANTLQGSVTNSTTAGRRLVTDGTGGFDTEIVLPPAYAMMSLVGNASAVATTAAVDSTLSTNSDYSEVDIAMTFDSVRDVTTGSNFLQIIHPGTYLLDFWGNVKVSTASTVLALKFVVNDVTFLARRPKFDIPSTGELHNFSSNGIHTFSAGDQIKLYVATTTATNVTLEDLTLQINLVELT